jgi:hypothetical protein
MPVGSRFWTRTRTGCRQKASKSLIFRPPSESLAGCSLTKQFIQHPNSLSCDPLMPR